MRPLALSLVCSLLLLQLFSFIPQSTVQASSLPQQSRIPSLDEPSYGTSLEAMGPITLRWTNPIGTAQYQIKISPYNNDGPGVNLIIGDALLVSSSSFTINPPVFGQGNYVLLPGMSYSWQVRVTTSTLPVSEGASVWGPWSSKNTFRTPAPSSSSIGLVSPSHGSTISGAEVALQWQNAASDIFYYEVQVSTDPQFKTGSGAIASVWQNLVHGGVTNPPNTWYTPQLQSGATYYWRVRPRVQGDGTPVSWSPTWSFTTPGGSPRPVSTSVNNVEAEVLVRINQIRQAHGLSTLSENGYITDAARNHSADMAAQEAMSHTGSDGSGPGDRMTWAGYSWSAYGEIVAYGYNTPQTVVDAWMNSPAHRDVILYGVFQEFGAGLIYSSSGRPYWTVDFGLGR